MGGAVAQVPGEWTWMTGTGAATNSAGSYGVLGLPSPSNAPPARFEPLHWSDSDGKLWIYGGHSFAGTFGDLWMFDPLTALWTWKSGSSSIAPPIVRGTMGVPSPANTPGIRRYLGPCWTVADDLWFYGAFNESPSNTDMGDLWKYNIPSGMWTWVKGPATGNHIGSYGVQGVPAPSNQPASRHKCSAAWSDGNGGLWMFGGSHYNLFGDLDDMWRYDIATDQWTWMKGSNTIGAVPVYGTLGVEAMSNTPGARQTFLSWKDPSGMFWLFSGTGDRRSDLWRFNPASNMWAWMGGSPAFFNTGSAGPLCMETPTNLPSARLYGSSCWTDAAGNFWLFGGVYTGTDLFNDLWNYDLATGEWTLVSGSTSFNAVGSYGAQGISSLSNMPPARVGSVGWSDQLGYFWVFGGYDPSNAAFNDMWRYVPDPACAGVSTDIPQQSLNGILVGPSPADASLSIHTHGPSTPATYSVVDMAGRTLLSPQALESNATISTIHWTPGVYSVVIEGQSGRHVRKFLIVH